MSELKVTALFIVGRISHLVVGKIQVFELRVHVGLIVIRREIGLRVVLGLEQRIRFRVQVDGLLVRLGQRQARRLWQP